MGEVILQGERVCLAPSLRRVKAETIFEHFQNREIIRYLTSVPNPYTLKDANDFIRYLELIEGDESTLELGIFERKEGRFIGMMALEDFDPEIGKAELGYWLAKDYWGQGYAFEAATLLLEYAFSNLKLQKVVAYLVKENQPSLRLLQKLGFQVDGLLRRDLLNKGELIDRYVCSLLVEEWEKNK